MLGYPFESEEARELNKAIFETMYHAAVTTSCAIAKERAAQMHELCNRYANGNVAFLAGDKQREYSVEGCADHKAVRDQLNRLLPVVEEFDAIKNGGKAGAYSSFVGSPASNGELQFDMWGVTPSGRYDWDVVRSDVKEYGLRNSLLLAPMPTASTSQILGNNECFEPFTSNIYSRRTIAGDYVVVNKHLMRELESLGIWSAEVKDMIVRNKGSVQDISGIPDDIKEKYKIVWEIPMRSLIDMAADRGAFICQSQSMNLWLEDPDYKTLTSMHFHAWSKGLKTGLYYLRRKPKHQPQQFTIVPPSGQVENDQEEGCLMCGA
jgi:ribonucleotide reductase alpha subunit